MLFTYGRQRLSRIFRTRHGPVILPPETTNATSLSVTQADGGEIVGA